MLQRFGRVHRAGRCRCRLGLRRRAQGGLEADRRPHGHGSICRRGLRYAFRQGRIISARAKDLGVDELPDFVAPLEDTRSAAAQRYPLAMISPPARNFLNSSFVNVQSLRAAEGEPWLDIHPSDALARGIAADSYVRVFNDRGTLELRARVTERARPGVVVALSVWWKKLSRDGKNANELTGSDTLTDLGRAPIFYDCLVQVEAL